jgi:hypothetical protein
MGIKATPYGPVHEVEYTSDILRVEFFEGDLSIAIAKHRLPSGKVAGLIVRFREVLGFRFLDEADLSRYWISDGFPRGCHVLAVAEGGWSEEENTLQGYEFSRYEWLVITGNGCLNVFASEEPMLEEAEFEYGA